MLQVTITTKGIPPDKFIASISSKFYFELQGKLVELAEEAVEKMREVIQSNKKRPSLGNNLENTITLEYLNTTGGVDLGIGNINKLKTDAPYFEVLDVGGYVPPANIGYFTSGSGLSGDKTFPEAGISGQTWVHTGKERGSFFMKPTKAIEGIDYVGIANRNLKNKLQSELSSWINNEIIKNKGI